MNVIEDHEQPLSCKQLLTSIDHPLISKSWLYRNSVVGSCNGLICLSVLHHDIDDPVYVYNPITQEYVYLLRFKQRKILKDCVVSGFGYQSSTNQYKVVRVYYDPFNDETSVGHIQVYTIGDGRGWRDVGETLFRLSCNSSPGIFMNGALHWVDDKQKKIVAFDLADEVFRSYPAPPCVRRLHTNDRNFVLREMGKCLCLVHWNYGDSVDIWALKKNSNYDMEEQADYYSSWSWTREFSIERKDSTIIEPLAITNRGEVRIGQDFNKLSLYDPKTATIKMIVDDVTGLRIMDAIPHMKSFVSLKALGENSKTRSRRNMQR